MIRLSTRTLTTAVLGGLLAIGGVAPAFAQQVANKDKDARDARKEQRTHARQQASQGEPPRAAVAQRPMAMARVQPERRENWGEQARQQSERRHAERPVQEASDRRQQMAERMLEQRHQQVERQSGQADDTSRRWAEQRALAASRGQERRHDTTRSNTRDDRLSNDQQRRLIERQRSQAITWQRNESARRSQIQHRSHELQNQRRNAQYRYQQDYYRRWLAQQSRWNASRYEYGNDPYYYTASNYRYGYGGNWYNTNQYGANLLQRAVRDGYQEGYYAGGADRQDGWRFDYRNSYAYTDGSYGYNGYYVNQNDYRYYFQQGFQRGYNDAYYGRSQYGRYNSSNGLAVILPVILSTILGFQNY